ncbi:MAG TPA: carbonic anhydrase family protein [Thermoanaerobaculia bacterium]|nr:carbonic anhydrase family protein [Thermoanaerobaculia bacterium]
MRKMILLMLVALPCLGDDCPTKYGYSGANGPAFWGSLNPEWKTCSTGIAQSPVDINSLARLDNSLSLLTFNGGESTFKVQNTGNNLKIRVDKKWTLNDDATVLDEFHFHTPAEHYDRGYQHAGEIHFVYKVGARIIVVAVWIREGAANRTLQKILDMKPAACKTSDSSTATIDIKGLLANPQHYGTYQGSLTTPGCSENVTFLITLDGITASKRQLAALRVLPGGNARPLQGMKFRQAP